MTNHIRRRDFVTFLGGATSAWPMAVSTYRPRARSASRCRRRYSPSPTRSSSNAPNGASALQHPDTAFVCDGSLSAATFSYRRGGTCSDT
jgi:hypothetical protein